MKKTVISVFALATVVLLSACATGGAVGEAGGRPVPLDPALAQTELLWRARMDSARTRFTDADVKFMTGMIGHHAQALAMSAMAVPNGGSATIRTLAARITNAQKDEIELMQKWLRDRSLDVPEVHLSGTHVMVHGGASAHEGHDHMPGMLTDEQMEELRLARGVEFDKLFLTYMIEHHNGAVHMVDELFSTDGAAQDVDVFRFASDVQVDQRTEVDRMKLMLGAMSSSGR